MALGTLRRRRGRRADEDPILGIGELDARILNCPVCSRPIVSDARRCPGCRTRLLMGVSARKVGAFVAAGAVVGALVGGGIVGAATTALRPAGAVSPASAAASPGALSPASLAPGVADPVAPAAPVVPAPAAPAAAIAALRQTVAINERLVSADAALRATLSAEPFESSAVASALRALAVDAAIGSDAAARLRPWEDAAEARAALAAVYDQVRSIARRGLAAGLANQGAYRSAATDMLDALAAVGAVDKTARGLAASVRLQLPEPDAP